MRREPVDNRTSRISKGQQLCNFVECLSRGIISCVPDVADSTRDFLRPAQDKDACGRLRRPARARENPVRNCSLLPLLEKHSMDVALKMVHRDQRLVERERKRLGEADANKQRSCQARPLCDGNRVDRFVCLLQPRRGLAARRGLSRADARATPVRERLLRKGDEWRSARLQRSTRFVVPREPPPLLSRHRSFQCRGWWRQGIE